MFTPSDLEAYLDEALPPEEMARIEKAAHDDAALAGAWRRFTPGGTKAFTRSARFGAGGV